MLGNRDSEIAIIVDDTEMVSLQYFLSLVGYSSNQTHHGKEGHCLPIERTK